MGTTFKRNEQGSVVLIFGLSLAVLLLVVGVAVDFYRLTLTAARLQAGADGAALALAIEVSKNNTISTSQAQIVADSYGKKTFNSINSPYPGTSTQQITSRDPAVVQVTLSQNQQLFFGGLIGLNRISVARSATATAPLGEPVCLLVLDPASANSWSNQGSSSVEATDCVAQVNSTSASGLATNGSAVITTLKTLVAGPIQNVSGFSPKPLFNQAIYSDPVAAKITWPSPSTCDYLNLKYKNETATLTPGTLCGGLTLSSGAILTLDAGLYVLKTGGLSLSSGSTLIAMKGSTIILLDTVSTIDMQSGASMQISAPTEGPWRGLVLAQKPQDVELTSSLVGGGETEINGVVYLPTQKLSLTGGGSLSRPNNIPRTFVIRRIEMSGNGKIYLAGSSDLVSMPPKIRIVN